MIVHVALRTLAAAMLLWVHAGFASEGMPTSETGARQVQARKQAEYRNVVDRFDQAIANAPNDAALAVERCRFIGRYVDDEYGDWVESGAVDFEACQAALRERWSASPVAQMFALEQLWDDEEVVERANELLPHADDWPVPLRRQLYTQASQAEENNGSFDRAGALAVEAAKLGEPTRVARAVRFLAGRGEHEQAARLLASVPPAQEQWTARGRVEAAFELTDRKAAVRELARHENDEWTVDAATAAQAHLRAGDLAAARKAIANESHEREPLQKARFDIAMADGDTAMAMAAIRVTDTAHLIENLQRFITLAVAAPSTLAKPQMMLGTMVLVLISLVLALLPGLVLLPVHYRGLVRRVRGRPADPVFPIGLGAAWWAGAVLLVVPLLVALVTNPAAFGALVKGAVVDGVDMFQVMLWGTLAGLACIAPALRPMDARQLVGGRDAWLAARWRLPFAWVCVVGVSMLVATWHAQVGGGGETLQTKSMQALATGASQAYGLLVTLMLGAVLVPIFEELVFRGLLLGGLTRHIGFGWANALQATIFALVHDDAPRFAFYLALGLFTGWLVKRTKSVGPAIALHALNNALAFGLMASRH